MKIEKVNDHQIRCTLTREDLADRELKLSELAYGTEKAKDLFRDMMQQASFEFGFEAEDIPLMIEAIPLNSECIVLIITKVEDPDELDTRFSKLRSRKAPMMCWICSKRFKTAKQGLPLNRRNPPPETAQALRKRSIPSRTPSKRSLPLLPVLPRP